MLTEKNGEVVETYFIFLKVFQLYDLLQNTLDIGDSNSN